MPTTVAPARFTGRESLIAAPGSCYLCNTHVGPFVDTNIVKRADRIAICFNCITELHGFLPAPVAEPEPAHVKVSPEEYDDLVSLADIGRRVISAALSSDSAVFGPSANEGDSEGDDSGSEGVNDSPEQKHGNRSKQGRAKLPSDTGDGPLQSDGGVDLDLGI